MGESSEMGDHWNAEQVLENFEGLLESLIEELKKARQTLQEAGQDGISAMRSGSLKKLEAGGVHARNIVEMKRELARLREDVTAQRQINIEEGLDSEQ